MVALAQRRIRPRVAFHGCPPLPSLSPSLLSLFSFPFLFKVGVEFGAKHFRIGDGLVVGIQLWDTGSFTFAFFSSLLLTFLLAFSRSRAISCNYKTVLSRSSWRSRRIRSHSARNLQEPSHLAERCPPPHSPFLPSFLPSFFLFVFPSSLLPSFLPFLYSLTFPSHVFVPSFRSFLITNSLFSD